MDFDTLYDKYTSLKSTDKSPLAESIRGEFYRAAKITFKRGEAKGDIHPNYDPMPNFWSTWASIQNRD
jgi:hypothetical protein